MIFVLFGYPGQANSDDIVNIAYSKLLHNITIKCFLYLKCKIGLGIVGVLSSNGSIMRLNPVEQGHEKPFTNAE